MRLPSPRGGLSEAVGTLVRTGPPCDTGPGLPGAPDDVADEQLTLWLLYELHYAGFEDVDDAWEWHPELLRVRRGLEGRLESRLRSRYAASPRPPALADHVEGFDPDALFAYVAGHDGRSLATYVRREADEEQVRHLLRMRSLYHLKETDPTAWIVPRLPRAAQAALVELMYDEYGAGRPGAVHSRLFADAMDACGLDSRRGAYVDDVPVEVLEQNNAMTLFGLHRRLVGAAAGHFAAFEMTSSLPSRRMAQGLDRLGLPPAVAHYYTEHVEADAVHEQLAARGLCAGLVDEQPAALAAIYLGAFTCLDLEDRVAGALLRTWSVAA